MKIGVNTLAPQSVEGRDTGPSLLTRTGTNTGDIFAKVAGQTILHPPFGSWARDTEPLWMQIPPRLNEINEKIRAWNPGQIEKGNLSDVVRVINASEYGALFPTFKKMFLGPEPYSAPVEQPVIRTQLTEPQLHDDFKEFVRAHGSAALADGLITRIEMQKLIGEYSKINKGAALLPQMPTMDRWADLCKESNRHDFKMNAEWFFKPTHRDGAL